MYLYLFVINNKRLYQIKIYMIYSNCVGISLKNKENLLFVNTCRGYIDAMHLLSRL